MHLPSGGKLLGWAASLLLAVAWYIVHETLGQTASFRFWGAALLIAAVVLTCWKTIPVTLGNTEITPLEGWRKAYVLVPAYGIALAVVIWPHAVACAVNLRGYVCS
jgi:hypothetical protein